jgi:ribosomal protein L11 methyltransferase
LSWIEIIVPATAATVDDVAALLVDEVTAAAAGIEVRGDEAVFWTPVDGVEAALAETRAAVARWALDPSRVRAAPAMPEAEWRDAWKRYFHVSRVTRQLVVVPSWETFDAAQDDRVIALDPGMAFGTGTHASTRLVLDELQRMADEGQAHDRVLDVGAGSGILAIAACKLWPRTTCIAIDTDPLAVAACVENAAHNGVGDRIASSATALGDVAERFPVVLANIQAHVLRALAADLVARTSGTLILSGLLAAQAPPLADEFAAAGMTLVAIRPSTVDPQWSAIVLRARP